MRSGRRVVVTGLGVVSAVGTDIDRFWSWLCSPQPAPVTTPVSGFDASTWMSPKAFRRSAPFARYALAAARQGLLDAALDPDQVEPRRAGVVLSTVYGSVEPVEAEAAVHDSQGEPAVSPFLTALACENAPASVVSADLRWRGPSTLVVTACAGGTDAVSAGADLVASGRCEVVVAGGTQGSITPVLMAAYRNLRVLSPSGWVRPFDRRRDGFVFAEGAAVMVLEPLAVARSRRARIYAEILGHGHTNDASSLVAPTGPGAIECMLDALDDAELEPDQIGHVNAHGTGTSRNDEHEAASLHQVFGTPPPVTSIKRVLGHAAGASGAFEAVASALAVHHSLVPSLGSDVEADDRLQLDLVVGEPRSVPAAPVLSNSFGLGGHNACIVLGPVR